MKKNEEGDTEGENEEAEDEEESQKCSENFEEHDHVDTESGERKGGKGEEGRQIPGEFPDEKEKIDPKGEDTESSDYPLPGLKRKDRGKEKREISKVFSSS